jgi:glycosyltransferase involved in cell wall biosynthesis
MKQTHIEASKQLIEDMRNIESKPFDAQPVTFSLVIPAFNEEKGIADTMHRALAIKPRLVAIGIASLELIVVDDGSSDRTAEVVRSHSNNVKLVQHVKNRGYGAALKSGFHAASGQFLGFLDADGTYPPEYFPDRKSVV